MSDKIFTPTMSIEMDEDERKRFDEYLRRRQFFNYYATVSTGDIKRFQEATTRFTEDATRQPGVRPWARVTLSVLRWTTSCALIAAFVWVLFR